MGHSYQFECKDCKTTQHLYEGWGFMVHDQSVSEYLSNNKLKLHYKTNKKVIVLSKQHSDLQLRMEYQIYRCKTCLQVSDRLFVQVMDGDKTLHKTKFRCPSCHVRLKHTNIHSLKYATCPRCKSYKFSKSKELVLWE